MAHKKNYNSSSPCQVYVFIQLFCFKLSFTVVFHACYANLVSLPNISHIKQHRLVKETVDFNDMEVLKGKYSIEFLSRVKQWAFTQAVSPYWRGPSRKSKKKKRKLEKNESARARNSGSEAHEKWALRRAIPFYLVLN